MQIDLNRFRDTFFAESEEHVAEMEAGLLVLEQQPGDVETLNAVFRGAHSIKGAAGSFGFDTVVRFTHSLENLLDRMRAGELDATQERIGVLLRSVDVLRCLLADAAGSSPLDESARNSMEEVLRELLVAQRATAGNATEQRIRKDDEAPAASRTYDVTFRPSPDVFRSGMDPILVLRELGRVGQIVELSPILDWTPDLDSIDPHTCYMAWHIRIETPRVPEEIRDVFAFVEEGAEISIRPVQEAKAAQPEPVLAAAVAHEATSIRVATNKVDKLIDLVGELVIAESMTAQLLNGFTHERLAALQQSFAEMERYTRELQERVMGIRMLPIGTIFSRFPRVVRDIAAATGKRIELELAGGDTELDKGVVERMSDPLIHLIRNAIDHGIEEAEERAACGKPEEGRIRVEAFHQGGNVIVQVSDDGRGLDTDRILRKAVKSGLVTSTRELTDAEIHALIFEPGFSTAEVVSDLSGRGVGMDVVKRGVESLNGSIQLLSEFGRGTTVQIKLPLTLAILDGLLVRVGAETWVLPLISIVESMRPSRDQVSRLAGRAEVVNVRGEPLPLVRLHDVFSIPDGVADPERGLIVIVDHQAKHVAILVDEVLGQQQVVIKSLEAHYRRVDGVIGATILGDGQAALILDVSGVIQLARSLQPAA